MKKLLSIILATAMLISLIPAVFAADTETGIKVVYNFVDETTFAKKEEYTYTIKGEQKTAYKIDATLFTYAASKGFWEYAENSTGDKIIKSAQTSGVRFNTSYNSFQVVGGATTGAYWVAFKIYVPKTGTYALDTTVNYAGTKSNIFVNAFIFKPETVASAGTTINEKILAGMTDDNMISTDAFPQSDANSKKTLAFTKEMVLEEGEHYFVFNPTSNTGSNVSYLRLLSLTLTEDDTGTGNAIMGGEISGVSDTLEIGDAETVAATGYLSSTGAEISDFTYSVEGNAVEIAGDTVTAKEAGTATIIATSASAVEGCNTITKTVKVVKQDEALTGAFIQEAAKEDITESYTAPTVAGLEINGSAINPDSNGDGSYNLTAPETKGDKKFLYWAKGMETEKRIISFSNVLEKYVPDESGITYLIAVYEGDITDTKNEYYNINGQLIAKQADAPTDLPSIPGLGTAEGWDPCGGNIYVARYADLDRDNITVTVNGGTGTQENVPYGTLVTCTADAQDASGKPFKCWTKKGVNEEKAEIVSIDDSYSFYAWEDCTVEAVYEDHYYTGSNMKIIIDSFDIDNGVTGVMAEFIGLDSAVEKGIMFTNSEGNETKIPMTTTDNQLAVVADGAGTYTGYAILKESNVYKMITGGSYSK